MSPVRFAISELLAAVVAVIGVAAVGCAPAQKASAPAAAPTAEHEAAAAVPQPPASAPPTAKRCGYSVRRVSASGRGAMRPQLAAGADAFAVAWEETTDHRGIRVQTFAPDAQPLGPSIEVADVARAAAEPHLAANPAGDGFAVFWSAAHGDASAALQMRRDRSRRQAEVGRDADRRRPRRARARRRTDRERLRGRLVELERTAAPARRQLRPTRRAARVGKPLAVTRAPSPDPTVDIASGPTLGRHAPTVLAWDRDRRRRRARHRRRSRRAIASKGAPISARARRRASAPASSSGSARRRLSIWIGARRQRRPRRCASRDGHVPAAAPRAPLVTALCYLRDADPSDRGHVDELICGTLLPTGTVVDDTRIAVGARGIFGLQVATSGGAHRRRLADARTTTTAPVSFAALTCPDVATAPPPK